MSATRMYLVEAILVAWAVSASAQPPAAKPAAAEPADQPAAEQPLREQTIYVPYAKMRKIFEQPGRGVFLPYEEFQTLWKEARAAKLTPPEQKPPLDALITDIENEATVAEEVVNVTAKLKIEVLTPGWHQVPLRLTDAAISKAQLGDQPARIISVPNVGYALLIEKKGKQAEQLLLTLEYAKAFTKSPGQNTVNFQAPQAPVNRWKIRIPQSGVKVNVQPLIAATQEPAAAGPEKPAKETVVLAFVGSSPTVQIDWTPKAEGAAGLEALATAQADQQVTLDEGVLRTRTQLAYKISRAELTKLTLEAPASHKVLNVFDANVKEWKVEKQGEVNTITVQLYEPARETQNLTVELEQFHEDLWKEAGKSPTVTTPVVKALGVGQQQGVLVVRVASTLRAEAVNPVGLLQLDAGELPKAFAGQPWTYSYRYAAVPSTLSMLTLRLEKVQPQIRTRELVEAYLEPERLTLDLFAIYEIERAGVFQLELDLPPKFEVRQVRGHQAADAQAAAVDAHHVEGENKTRLIVNLSRKALGKVGLFVELQQKLDDPNLLQQKQDGPRDKKAKAANVALPLPRVAPAGIERSIGRLIVYAPVSLRVNPLKQDGLQPLSEADALEGTASTRAGRFDKAQEIFAFGYGREPVDLLLSVERRPPHISVDQLLVARIEAGVVKYEATFFYNVRYSSVKSLRLDVPTKLAQDLRNQTTAVVSEAKMSPQPADVDKGYEAWSLTGTAELKDELTVKFEWERKIGDDQKASAKDKGGELEVGKSIDLTLPNLRPRDVDRASGQIVLTKAEALDLRIAGQPKGLLPMDPQQGLTHGVRIDDAARAFEFHADWELAITATRYQLEEVKRTSLERALVRMVVTRSKEISVQAVYRVRSARQRLAMSLPAEAQFDTQPLRIDGVAKSLEKGDKDEYYIPLVGQNTEKPFVLEVRYTLPHGDYRYLDVPEFPEEPAVQKLHLCVYLPWEWTVVGVRGAWTDETNWPWLERQAARQRQRGEPVPQPVTDASLIQQVIKEVLPNPPEEIHHDGRLYTFATLRPAAAPDGTLRLVVLHEWWFKGLVFGLVVLLGAVMLLRPLCHKLVALLALVAVLILAGVFLPTLSRQMLEGTVFYNAIAVVAALWASVYVVKVYRWVAAEIGPWRARLAARRSAAAPPVAEPPVASPFVGAESPAAQPEQGGQSHE